MDTVICSNPLKINLTDNRLEVDGKSHSSSVRTIAQMQDVLLNQELPTQEPLYYMYRSVAQLEDLRYDITLILPKILSDEYAKTYGHYHPKAQDGLAYPEVYQVISGEAKFLLQKKNNDGSVHVIIATAKKGDCIVFPPSYGHVTINSSEKDPLLLANIVYANFESDYSEYKKLRGGAIYYTKHGVVQNTNYVVKNIEYLTVKELNNRYGFLSHDLLQDLFKNPKKFEFLKMPSLKF
ncbi:MAG: glucose-6-phosphate isomerase family protein [Candidatus Micrarchaeota archaeon]|nr:glucose-6-phosphate isomerase family protein [Candidatus Micrarchaeota archaeon]